MSDKKSDNARMKMLHEKAEVLSMKAGHNSGVTHKLALEAHKSALMFAVSSGNKTMQRWHRKQIESHERKING